MRGGLGYEANKTLHCDNVITRCIFLLASYPGLPSQLFSQPYWEVPRLGYEASFIASKILHEIFVL